MAEPIIKVEHLGKKYRIGEYQPYYSLRDSIVGLFHRGQKKNPTDTIWALKNVNFEVKPGEALGIIGRNGAGKSTLLKVLSQITPPTSGEITMRGRVGSLLEVGTGFHPELTGRENIYLNGAILGMTRSEVRRKFDQIVEFAEIEKFLGTPVKHYSSGMYVRLAFAVAAHLEPEILLVDEVLAVGDVAFQKKCLGKMDEVARAGRTIVFVSHNMAAIQNLCTRCFVLDQGKIVKAGQTHETVQYYLDHMVEAVSKKDRLEFRHRHDRQGTQELMITSVYFRNARTRKPTQLISGQPVNIYLGFENRGNIEGATASISFNSLYGYRLLTLWSKFSGDDLRALPHKGFFVCEVPKFPLRAGRYTIDVYADHGGSILDVIYNAAPIDVEQGDFYGSGYYPTESQGEFMVGHRWKVVRE